MTIAEPEATEAPLATGVPSRSAGSVADRPDTGTLRHGATPTVRFRQGHCLRQPVAATPRGYGDGSAQWRRSHG
ncbi:hypothetical protein Vlu01_49280 [Micromonospora lutea]|uniref:Uncharacterized protein n=1 Tax=Micromonospora lutea TaxID=419825 RepID=A0ABQ4J2E8_9ACTN|nr:hypothetical protein Vlu01_49280 [Micromonospora lutea]